MLKTPMTRFVARDGGRTIYRLCFGRPASQTLRDGPGRPETVHHFLPGQVFGVVWRWRDPDGPQHRTLAVVQAAADPDRGHGLPGIYPEACVHAMVCQSGPAGQEGAVDRMLDLIQELRQSGREPVRVSPRYWRSAAYRIMLRQEPPHLTDEDYAGSEQSACDA